MPASHRLILWTPRPLMTEFGIGALGYERKERKERNQKRHISLEKKYKLKNTPKVVPLVPLVP